MAEGSPEQSEEIVKHRFTFNLQNNQWELVSDEIIDAPGSTRGSSEEVIAPLPVAPDVAPSDPLAPPTSDQSSLPSVLNSSVQASSSKMLDYSSSGDEFNNSPVLLAQASLNRQAIIQYIYYYALTPNRDYRNFENAGIQGGDCTNICFSSSKSRRMA
ncbi:MAG: hypothetical protein RIB93_09680 [Coleofasciculus sp. D1-CHI-01]|uniref:hypothetical protein n=1 Tax=Coleofasciculus sp. D1-CHI-01 TaxID=3068482 RepID=UPI0032F4D19B